MPEFDRAMVASGEQSGRLDDALRLLARTCRERAASLRATLNGLIYPAAVFHVAVLIMPTTYLSRAFWEGEWGAFLAHKVAVLVPLYVLVAALLWLTRDARGRAWRAVLERVFALVPLLGGAQRALTVSRLSLALHGLFNAGVPALRAWPLAAAASGSPGLERVVVAWRPALEAGATPAELVLESGAFPPQFASLYHTGEVSGRIDEVLPRLAAHYQEEGERKLRQAAAGFTWLVYGTVVALAAWQVISFWSGYYGAILGVGE
jgi:type II secretory pathway component PulF